VLEVPELEVANKFFWNFALLGFRVNRRLALDGVENLSGRCGSSTESLKMGKVRADGDTSNHSGHNDCQNIRNAELAVIKEPLSLPECQ